MGVYPPAAVAVIKGWGIRWFANVMTLNLLPVERRTAQGWALRLAAAVLAVGEAHEAVLAGAGAVVAQGMDTGGIVVHFELDGADTSLVGLFALLQRWSVRSAIGGRSDRSARQGST